MLDFSKIDHQNKAYLLGFLAADGSIDKYNRSVSVYLSAKDRNTVRVIRDQIQPSRPITKYTQRKTWGNAGIKSFDFAHVSFNSRKLCEQLNAFGIHNNKSLSLKPPKNLPPDMIKHFIRGYFDGDGGLSNVDDSCRQRDLHLCITSTRWVLEWVAAHFREINNNEVSVFKDKGYNCYRLHYGGSVAIDFCRWIYTDAELFMKRKYDLVEKFLLNPDQVKHETHWGISEEFILLTNFNLSSEDLQRLLPRRSKKAINNKKCRFRANCITSV